jgi:type I restriction enzyme, S subunit
MSNSFGNQWKIPKAWKIVSIKSITSDWRGGAPFKPDDFTDEGFPVLHKGAIHKSGTVLVDSRKKTFTSAEYAQCYQKSVIDRTYMAVTLRDLVPSGPSIGLIANLANSQSEKYVLAQGAYGFHINTDKVHPSYLVWLSNYEPFRAYMKCYAVGSTQIHIRTPVFQELEIPLPPLEEQKRIAAILDKADRVRRKRQEAIRLTEELGRSIFLDMFGDPVTNPKGWETKKLSELTDVENGDRSSNYPSGSDVLSEGILFLSTKNIVNSSLNLEQKQCISKEKFDSLSRGKLKQGDIVITLRGTLGNCCIFESSEDTEGFINAQLMIIRVKNALNNHFLHTLIISIPMNKYLQSLGTGAAVPQLTAQQIKNLDIIHPPISAQQDFLAVKHRSIKLYSQNQKHFYESENLFNSLLQRAFRGEL